MSNKKQTLNEVRSVRNNNPGNLRAADTETQKKLTQPGWVLDKAIGFDKDGFAIFPDKETGMSAMQRQIEIDASRGMTGADMIRKYAPKDDRTPLGQKYPNDPDVYINNVFGQTGLDPNKPIDPKDIGTIQQAMIKQEGGEGAVSHFYGNEGKPQLASTSSSLAPAAVAATGAMAATSLVSSRNPLTRITRITRLLGRFDNSGTGEESRDPGTLSQYRGAAPLHSNSIRSAQGRLQAAIEARAQRQAKREEERKARAERIAQRVAVRKAKRSPTKLAENTIRFKDLRQRIQEQIIINEEKENINESLGFMSAQAVKSNFNQLLDKNQKNELKQNARKIIKDKGILGFVPNPWVQANGVVRLAGALRRGVKLATNSVDSQNDIWQNQYGSNSKITNDFQTYFPNLEKGSGLDQRAANAEKIINRDKDKKDLK